MEKRINKKFDQYIIKFKEDIRKQAGNLDLKNAEPLIQYIFDYQRIDLDKEDFAKRKRAKNVVPFFERCCAKRANGDQCTRRKKGDDDFCGTHSKGSPHGTYESGESKEPKIQKIEVFSKDFNGIIYYLDHTGNVYDVEDVLSNSMTPKIIARYTKNEDNVYSIPDFNI